MEKSLTKIKGIGVKRAEILHAMGINTTDDLLGFLPRDYLDLTKITPISEMEAGETVLLSGTVSSDIKTRRIKNMTIYTFDVQDESPRSSRSFLLIRNPSLVWQKA